MSASVKKEVSIAQTNAGLAAGKKIFTPESFSSSINRINTAYGEQKSAEKGRRRYSSIKKAQGVQQNFLPGTKFNKGVLQVINPATKTSSVKLIFKKLDGCIVTKMVSNVNTGNDKLFQYDDLALFFLDNPHKWKVQAKYTFTDGKIQHLSGPKHFYISPILLNQYVSTERIKTYMQWQDFIRDLADRGCKHHKLVPIE